MKRIIYIALATIALSLANSLPTHAAPPVRGGGEVRGGGVRGGGTWSGGGVRGGSAWHGGGWHGEGWHGGVGVWVGPGWWPGWWGYPDYPYYPYYPYYTYPYYLAPPAVAPPQSYEYIQPEEPSYWYFCQDPNGYYPYVKRCPKGWLKVVPSPAPKDKEE